MVVGLNNSSGDVLRIAVAVFALVVASCANVDEDSFGLVSETTAELSAAKRQQRASIIRDAAKGVGLNNGLLLVAIAEHEGAGMAHCASEFSACAGPASSSCGGGAVLAGGGDGACSLKQGGLGMFQFDAGTHAQTLAAYGADVLTEAGSTRIAVDYVVNRLIIKGSSQGYVPAGITTRGQALAYLNQLDLNVPENARLWTDLWLRYYNGCVSGSRTCTDRWSMFRSNIPTLSAEFPPGFWNPTPQYKASFVSQSFPTAYAPGEMSTGSVLQGYIELKNEGTAPWSTNNTYLGTTAPRDMHSPFYAEGWISPDRVATVPKTVMPGETARFGFLIKAPDQEGLHVQHFNLVQERVAWFSDPVKGGGPSDDFVAVAIEVIDTFDSGSDGGVRTNPDAGMAPSLDPKLDGVTSNSTVVGSCSLQRGGKAPSWFLVMFGLLLSRRSRQRS